MKHRIIYTVLAGATLSLAACQPEEYDLGAKGVTADDLVEGLAYTVEVNQETNEVTLKSLLGNQYTALWSHPQGRSQKSELSLKIPFAGSYEVTFGVETRGGVIYGAPYTFEVEKLKPELLEDPLWAVLSGGVGESKTWLLDIDADGVSKYFNGPLYFYGTDDSWETMHGAVLGEGADSWNWCPDFAGNSSWLFGSTGAMDYGSMTFDLKDGANITVVDKAANKTYTGTYLMDAKAHTMKLTDAPVLHDPGRESIVNQWGIVTIMSMTEDAMQLGVIRDNDPSEGPCLLVYNFISKDYADNWAPAVDTGGDDISDPYSGDALNDMTTVTTTTLSWQLDTNAPYDWYWWSAANGEWQTNGFASLADYSATTWAPAPTADAIGKFSLIMSKTSDNGGQYALTNTLGDSYEGKFTSDSCWIDFGQELTFLTAAGTKSLEITAQKLRIVKTETTSGQVSGLWLGAPDKYNTDGVISQYLCLKLTTATEEVATPAKVVDCDNSKILYGDLEGNGNFRIEIYNSWGNGTADDAPINRDELIFSEKCVVTFTVSGLGTLAEPVTAFLMCSNANVWNATDAGAVPCEVTGDGTYTVSVEGSASAAPDVFLIDILGAANQTSTDLTPDATTHRCPNVSATIESIKLDGNDGESGGGSSTPSLSTTVDCDNSKILYGDLEGNKNFRIEIYNSWGSGTADDAPINKEELIFSKKCVVTFTVSGFGTLAEPVTAFLMCSNANVWNATDAGAVPCEVTGDGTYTVSVEGSATAAPDVFVIDILGVANQTSTDLTPDAATHRCPNVTTTIDSIKMD